MHATLHDRILSAVGDRTYASLGDLTRTNPETVRRYMSGQLPSVEFLTNLCGALGISGHWLLTGRGPMRQTDVRGDALRSANTAELMGAMSHTLQRLIERVEILEQFVQRFDVSARAVPALGASGDHATGRIHEQGPAGAGASPAEGDRDDACAEARVEAVRLVIAGRSCPDAR